MAENLYSTTLVEVMKEKTNEFAQAADEQAVEGVIAEVQKEAAERIPTPLQTDPWIYRGTVVVLGLAVLLVAIAQYHITLQGKNVAIPDGLIAIGSVAIGALAGLLAPTQIRG